jgi:hypothetical protein
MKLFNNKDGEKLKNFILFRFWGTDKELKEASPIFTLVFLAAIMILVGLFIFS